MITAISVHALVRAYCSGRLAEADGHTRGVKVVVGVAAAIAFWLAAFLLLVALSFAVGGTDCDFRPCNGVGEFLVSDAGAAAFWVVRVALLIPAVAVGRFVTRKLRRRATSTRTRSGRAGGRGASGASAARKASGFGARSSGVTWAPLGNEPPGRGGEFEKPPSENELL
jgi:hypothetical protein